MPVIKRTRDQLDIRCLSFRSMGALVRFNRPRGEIVLTWLAGILPIRRAVLPLDEIAGAQVRKVERYSGRITYCLVLRRRRSAADVSFACTSREEAMSLMREISSFLEIQTDEPEPSHARVEPVDPAAKTPDAA